MDGWIARRWGLQTVVGTVIDPMADKALMTVVTITLAMKGALPGESSLPEPRFSCSTPYPLIAGSSSPMLRHPLIRPHHSYPRRHNLRPRHSPRPLRLVLPLHFPPSSTHLCPLLGFLAPQRRSAAYYNFQNQHISTAGVDWSDDVRAGNARIGRHGADRFGS